MTDTEALKALVAACEKEFCSPATEGGELVSADDESVMGPGECAITFGKIRAARAALERMLASQLNNPEAEAVAYLYSKDGFDQVVLAEMAYPKMREELISEGWTIAPLYRSPPAALSPDKLMGLVRMVQVGNEGDWNQSWSAATLIKLRKCLPELEALLSQEDKQ